VYIFGDSHFALLLSHNILRHGHVRLDEYLARPLDPRLLRHRPNTELYQIHRANGHYFLPDRRSVLSIPGGPAPERPRAVARRSAVGTTSTASWRCSGSASLLMARSPASSSCPAVCPPGGALIAVAAPSTRAPPHASCGHRPNPLLGVVILILVASERRRGSPARSLSPVCSPGCTSSAHVRHRRGHRLRVRRALRLRRHVFVLR
jgi:hypothetical protein